MAALNTKWLVLEVDLCVIFRKLYKIESNKFIQDCKGYGMFICFLGLVVQLVGFMALKWCELCFHLSRPQMEVPVD